MIDPFVQRFFGNLKPKLKCNSIRAVHPGFALWLSCNLCCTFRLLVTDSQRVPLLSQDGATQSLFPMPEAGEAKQIEFEKRV